MYPFKTFTLGEIKSITKNNHISKGEPIMYKFFGKLCACYLQKFIPASITPNFITMLGFAATFLNYMLILVFDIEMNGTPRWLALINALVLLFYIFTDSIDGIHARATNQCSPIGKILDHFVDSNAVFYLLITLSSTLRIGFSSNFLCLTLCLLVGFYVAEVGEKFTGVLNFGMISGSSEGLYCMLFIHLLAFLKPVLLSQVTHILKESPIILIISTVIYLSYILFDLLYTLKTSGRKIKYSSVCACLLRCVLLMLLFVPLFYFKKTHSLYFLLTFSQCFSICYLEEYIAVMTKYPIGRSTFIVAYTIILLQVFTVVFAEYSRFGHLVQLISTLHFVLRCWLVLSNLSNQLGVDLLKIRK